MEENTNINNPVPSQDNKKNEKRKFWYNNKFKRRGYNQTTSRVNSFKKISVVIPLFNEEESLRPLAAEIKKVFSEMQQVDYEVLFIDDGSSDKSPEVLKELYRESNKFKFIQFNRNYGKSAALSVGFKHTTGDIVITMDADLQDDPKEIPSLLDKINEGYDLVSGWKKIRHDPFIKRTTSRIFNFVTSLTTGIKIHDFNCGLKAYKKEVIKSLNVYGEMHRYLPVLAQWNGFKVAEIPVQHHVRRYGKTKFGASRFIKGYLDLITIIFTTRYLKRPLHLFGTVGSLTFLAGLVINAILSIEWAFFKMPLSNRPMLLLGILLIILGVQFFSLGLLGEMIVHYSQSPEDYQIKTILL